MFIMSKLKIFLLPVFILVLLLPNMMVGQEVETQSQSQSAGGIIDEDLLMSPFYRKYFIKNGTIVAYKYTANMITKIINTEILIL